MPTTNPETASLTLFVAKSSLLGRDALEREFVRLQTAIFDCRGVIPPRIAIQIDDGLQGDTIEMAINNQRESRIMLPPDRLPDEADPASPQAEESKMIRELAAAAPFPRDSGRASRRCAIPDRPGTLGQGTRPAEHGAC